MNQTNSNTSSINSASDNPPSTSTSKMLKPRILKSLASLAIAAFVANSFSLLDPTPQNPDDYDSILLGVSRRLSANHNAARSRLHEIRQRHAQKLVERGLDPNSAHFQEVLQRKMNTVKNVRGERGGERKIRRRIAIGDEVWEGTPMDVESRKMLRKLDEDELPEIEPLLICDRPTNIQALSEIDLLTDYGTTCPGSSNRNMLLLQGVSTFGRTGNNLIEFLHALQMARDQDFTLGIMHGSWAMQVLMQMFMSIQDEDWEKNWEETFCAKVLRSEEDLEGWDVVRMSTKELFGYSSPRPYDEYVASTQYSIRTLLQNYNTGRGTSIRRKKVKDMCSGIDALFGSQKKHVLYSVIHSRHLEGAPGLRLLGKVCRYAKCDATAALEMRPDYIKSILEPLGMMKHPIVLITDGQDFSVIQRLMADKAIGPMLRVVPEEASWIGGDLTLGIMSSVFIGNPASTFSTFIAKSRLSLGFGQNYLFRKKNEEGEWITSCGDACVFDKRVMSVMS